MNFHPSLSFSVLYLSSFVLDFQTSVSGDSLSLFSGNSVNPLVAVNTIDGVRVSRVLSNGLSVSMSLRHSALF